VAGHVTQSGQVDELLRNDSYLLHADLRKLTMASYHAVTGQGRGRARLLRLTPQAITASPSERAAMFSITEALEQLGATYRSEVWSAPYTARWAGGPLRRHVRR